MGKKVSQAASSLKKISKSDKKQFNHLIKVLRPMVYITDSSSFKKLVQELTGNGNTTTTNSSTSPPPPSPPPLPLLSTRQEHISDVQAIHEDYHRLVVVPESSAEELSVDSYNESFSNELSWQNQACFDEITALDNYLLSSSTNLHGGEWSAYQDIESWLLDIEPFPSYNCGQVEQEVCIYDYELSGLI